VAARQAVECRMVISAKFDESLAMAEKQPRFTYTGSLKKGCVCCKRTTSI